MSEKICVMTVKILKETGFGKYTRQVSCKKVYMLSVNTVFFKYEECSEVKG